MPTIKIQATGLIDRGDSAFPTPVRLDNGDIVCGPKTPTQPATYSAGKKNGLGQPVMLLPRNRIA